MKILLISSAIFAFSACKVSETVFVVQRDVPPKPSFVVFPANDYLYQVEFANTIEKYLISSGVTVLTRPATKEIQATKQSTQVDVQPTQPASAQATLTERYLAFEDTQADYIVYSYADSKQIKIARRESKEILTSFVLEQNRKQTEQDVFKSALRALKLRTQ